MVYRLERRRNQTIRFACRICLNAVRRNEHFMAFRGLVPLDTP
jgi:hypothetical protein